MNRMRSRFRASFHSLGSSADLLGFLCFCTTGICSNICLANRFYRFVFGIVGLSVAVRAVQAQADTFGNGANSFNIDFVSIGNPGNPPEPFSKSLGAVGYEFRIGKYEISEEMINAANVLGGLDITKDARGVDYPATNITWYEAAKFVNWLNTSTGHEPAYKFDGEGNFQLWQPADAGYDPTNLYRNNMAMYVLPTVDEWHKAAYYDPVAGLYYEYPTSSNSIPDGTDYFGDPIFDAVFHESGTMNKGPNVITDVGIPSPYGTRGQAGNVAEWAETTSDRKNTAVDTAREFLGGSWTVGSFRFLNRLDFANYPSNALWDGGFRVAANVPEPNSLLFCALAMIGIVHTTSRTREPKDDLRGLESCFGA